MGISLHKHSVAAFSTLLVCDVPRPQKVSAMNFGQSWDCDTIYILNYTIFTLECHSAAWKVEQLELVAVKEGEYSILQDSKVCKGSSMGKAGYQEVHNAELVEAPADLRRLCGSQSLQYLPNRPLSVSETLLTPF